MFQFLENKNKDKYFVMVNDRAKNLGGPTTDKTKRSSPLEAIPHRSKKRTLSTMLTTRDEFDQVLSREQTEATRLLTKTPMPSKPTSSSRHSDSARLLKLVPDLTQKEVSRLVAALMKRQRDAGSAGKKREKQLTRTVPALFQEKELHQKLGSQEFAHGQRDRVQTPAREAAGSRSDALRMLREAEPHPDPSRKSAEMATKTAEAMRYRQDLAEELVHRASPR